MYYRNNINIHNLWTLTFVIILALASIQIINVIQPAIYPLIIIGFLIITKSFRGTNYAALIYLFISMFSIIINISNSTLENFVRFFFYFLMLVIFGPIFRTKLLLHLRYKFLSLILSFCIIITLISFIFSLLNVPIFIYELPPFNSFQGITIQPMLLAPISGLSLIFAYSNVRILTKRNDLYFLIIFFISIFVLINTGSRSALLASVAGLLFIKNEKMKKYLFILVPVLGVIFYSTFKNFLDSSAVTQKIEYAKDNNINSRSELWSTRIKEIKSSPFFGIGYANDSNFNKNKDRNIEPGSSWLYIISSTGFFGLLAFVSMLYNTFKVIRFKFKQYLETLDLPLLGILIFFAIHSFFEGYITFTGGMITYIFWSCLGVIYCLNDNFVTKKYA